MPSMTQSGMTQPVTESCSVMRESCNVMGESCTVDDVSGCVMREMREMRESCTFEHGMSKGFVMALRQVFDVFDDKKCGSIRLCDIAERWVEDETMVDLPRDFVKSLQRVTPPHGLLTFDRFCAGTRICLLKCQADYINNNSVTVKPRQTAVMTQGVRSTSAPLTDISASEINSINSPIIPIIKPTASVPPVSPHHPIYLKTSETSDLTNSESSSINSPFPNKTKSMPHLQSVNLQNVNLQNINLQNVGKSEMRNFQSDGKLLDKNSKVRNNNNNNNRQSTFSKSAIIKTLLSWRDNVLKRQNDIEVISSASGGSKENILTDTEINNRKNRLPPPPPPHVIQSNGPSMRSLNKRREPRRHTVGANGIDYNTIRRMQQIEQEREILLQGLNAVHQARDWYLKHIAIIQDKLKYVGRDRSHPADYSLDAYQERINFLAARILTVNQHLAALIDSERGFPIHMNLALRPINNEQIDRNRPQQLVVNPNVVNRLKEQNRLLTDEVGKKSERITQLEREKSALIRELFQARTINYQKNRHENDDTTFM